MTIAGTYTILNHDHLCTATHGGLTYSKFIQSAIKSASYKNELRRYNNDLDVMSPIELKRRAVFINQHHNDEAGFNLPGILLFIHHAFINWPATKKILNDRYTPDILRNGLPYKVVRAAAILAGELQPLSDPPALLAHLSCANFHFRRWTVHPYSGKRADNELNNTSYKESEVKGQKVMSIDYNLCEVAKGYRQSLDE